MSFPFNAWLRTMDAADPEDERGAFIFRPAKKSKTDLKAEAEALANARCQEYCKEKSKELTAVVRRWGCAKWVFRSPEPLWQIQVRHIAHPHAAFGDGLISTACRALVHHPAAEIHDLKTLFKEAKVKVLAGAPPEPGKGSTDPDRVGILDWVPVLYVAGAGPLEGLTVIKLVMEEKVRMGLMPQLPTFSLHWELATGEALPQVDIPALWTSVLSNAPRHWPQPDTCLQSPFSVLPPVGRRHVLACIQMAAKRGAGQYDLFLFGGIYYFREAFDRLKVPCRKMPIPSLGHADWVRLLYGFNLGDAMKVHIKKILEEALRSVPLFLVNGIEDAQDPLVQWLLEQPSVYLQRSVVDVPEKPPAAPAAAMQQWSSQASAA
jgi:hypothetical protein